MTKGTKDYTDRALKRCCEGLPLTEKQWLKRINEIEKRYKEFDHKNKPFGKMKADMVVYT